MHQDFKELLSAFNAGQVRYLIVGGYAVSFHAQPRATKDLDILIGADVENSKAVFAALARFGAPVEGLSAKDFAEPDNLSGACSRSCPCPRKRSRRSLSLHRDADAAMWHCGSGGCPPGHRRLARCAHARRYTLRGPRRVSGLIGAHGGEHPRHHA